MMSRLKKFSAVLLLWMALAHPAAAQTATLFTVENNGSRSQRINLVFLSEGYTTADMPNFAGHVTTVVNFLFSKEPWQQYRSYCNVFRIEIASNQSGCDNGNASGAGGTRDTYFSSGFNTPSVGQLLTLAGNGSTRAYALLNTHVPEYDVPIVLVNDTKYGGAGGALSIASVHGQSAAVAEHEIGHSFALLADEYDVEYTIYTPSEKPNNTAQTTRELIKWNHWINSTTPVPTPETSTYDSLVGLFEGSMYRTTGWYRPHNNSLMRSLNRPCGQVNREQFVLRFYSQVSPLDSFLPVATTASVSEPTNMTYQVTRKAPSSGVALTVTWSVNGVVQTGQTGPSFTVPTQTLGNGSYTVKATVQDPTTFVRLDPSGLLQDDVTWTLHVSGHSSPALSSWRSTYGADTEVSSADGLANLVKYALGAAADVPLTTAQQPVANILSLSGTSYLCLTIPRSAQRADILYRVEVSSNLSTWQSGAGHTVVLEDSSSSLVVRDAQPYTSANRRFIRLAVQEKPS